MTYPDITAYGYVCCLFDLFVVTEVDRMLIARVKTWKGRAQAVIRPSGTGNVKLIAESQGLKTGELVIQVTK